MNQKVSCGWTIHGLFFLLGVLSIVSGKAARRGEGCGSVGGGARGKGAEIRGGVP